MKNDRTNDDNYPKVIASGFLTQFGNIPVYNLDNGKRVFRLTDMTFVLRGKVHGKFGNYLATSNIRKYLPEYLRSESKDRAPQGVIEADLNGQIIKTYDSEAFIDICLAFDSAKENGEKMSIPQQEIADRAKTFIRATSKVGIAGVIDEATGYQYMRPKNELELKMAYLLTEDLRPWEKTFPDAFWEQLARLTNWPNPKKRPKYWGKLVNEFVYEVMDKDLAKYLQDNKPPKYTGQRYHQWLNENQGVKALTEHLWQVIGLAKSSDSVDDLRYEVQKNFSGNVFQPKLFGKTQLGQTKTGDRKRFGQLLDRAIKPSLKESEKGE